MARDLHRAIRAEAHHILMPAIGAGAMDGGCRIVARAIVRAVPGARVVTMMGDPGGGWRPEHYGAMAAGLIVDGAGVSRSPEGWIARFARLESVRWPLRFEDREVPSREIPRDEDAVASLAAALASACRPAPAAAAPGRGGPGTLMRGMDNTGASIWLETESIYGTGGHRAGQESQELANRLGVGIRLRRDGGEDLFRPGQPVPVRAGSGPDSPPPEDLPPGPLLLLRAQANGGAVIDDACSEAVALAGRTGAAVRFEFLGKSCLATPGADPRILLGGWLRDAGFPDPDGASRSRPASFAVPALSLCADASGFAGDRDAAADACDAAVRLSAAAGTSVAFEMAGVRCVARPDDDPAHLAANWLQARRDIESPGFASATFPTHRGPGGLPAPGECLAEVAR